MEDIDFIIDLLIIATGFDIEYTDVSDDDENVYYCYIAASIINFETLQILADAGAKKIKVSYRSHQVRVEFLIKHI